MPSSNKSRAPGVLKRFIEDNQLLLRNIWATGADLNVDEWKIEQAIQDLGITTSQSALGNFKTSFLHSQSYLAKVISQQTRCPDRSNKLAALLNVPASPYFALVEGRTNFPRPLKILLGSVGYGLAHSLKQVIELTQPNLVGKVRVMIQVDLETIF